LIFRHWVAVVSDVVTALASRAEETSRLGYLALASLAHLTAHEVTAILALAAEAQTQATDARSDEQPDAW
jgi:hypothetical protein